MIGEVGLDAVAQAFFRAPVGGGHRGTVGLQLVRRASVEVAEGERPGELGGLDGEFQVTM